MTQDKQPKYITNVNDARKHFKTVLEHYEAYIGEQAIAKIMEAHDDVLHKTRWATYMSSRDTGRSPS